MSDDGYEGLLQHLKEARGFDYSAYKSAGMKRRIGKRMQLLGIEGFESYQDFLEVNPDEYQRLFDTTLINVTSFFRDPELWTHLREEIVPELVGAADRPLRVWCAGVSSGQEAYSVAMLLHERLGDRFGHLAKIYATDVDEEALAQARQAVYPSEEAEAVPEDLRHRYLEEKDGRHLVRADLRRAVIFGRNDLLSDAPISRLDLLLCRNTLMYFNLPAQSEILRRFHFALQPHGYLVSGRAETLLSKGGLFRPVRDGSRVFVKAPVDEGPAQSRAVARRAEGRLDATDRLRDAAFASSPLALVLLDGDAVLVGANDQARREFSIEDGMLGRPFHELELSHRPAELRSLVDRALREGRSVSVAGVVRPRPGGEDQHFDVTVSPVLEDDIPTGTLVAFSDVSEARRLRVRLERTHHELESAYEELQSANEELETTNEELQATNEELETVNEELQATNEELHTINDELRIRTAEAGAAHAFLRSVFASLDTAAIVLSRDLAVTVWNHKAEELWGVREDEAVGRPFFAFDIGLEIDEGLRQVIRGAVAGSAEHTSLRRQARNRFGQNIECDLSVSPLRGPDGQAEGAVMLVRAGDGNWDGVRGGNGR